MEFELATAAVGLRTAMRYRRDWNRHQPIVKILQGMMPRGGKKGYRLYLPIGQQAKHHYTIPPAVRSAVKKAGFVITDYLAKKCVKANDQEQKNVFNIGKVIAKDPIAKAAFDNDPQLQNSKGGEMLCVISCHPYDIIGMSTGRDWDKTSCMRLDDGHSNHMDRGSNSHYVKRDVAEGTLVAYAVAADDQNINRPKARCLLKPFLMEDDKEKVLYRRETSVYGNNVPGFIATLSRFLRQLNADLPQGAFSMAEGLYDDGMGARYHHHGHSADNLQFEEVENDTTLATQFVKQQLRKLHKEDPATYHVSTDAKDIDRLLELDLHDTQIDEIEKLLSNESWFGDYASTRMHHNHSSPNMVELARRLGKAESLPEKAIPIVPIDMLIQRSTHGGPGIPELAKRIENIDREDDDQWNNLQKVFRAWISGILPVPEADDLENTPRVRSYLHTLAHAMKHLSLFDVSRGQKFAFDVIDKGIQGDLAVDDDFISLFRDITGPEAYLGYILENSTKLDYDQIWGLDPEQATKVLYARRPFRAFSKITDAKVSMYFGEVLKYMANTLAYTHPQQHTQYRDVIPTVKKWMDENPDEVVTMAEDYRSNQVINLAALHLPAIMSLNDNAGWLGYQGPETLGGLYPLVKAWTGEPLEPLSVDMEKAFLILVSSTKLLETPQRLESKFVDLEPDQNATKALFGSKAFRGPQMYSYANFLTFVRYEKEQPDISNDMDLVRSMGARALSCIPAKTMVRIYPTLIRLIQGYTDLEEVVDGIQNMSQVLELPKFIDPDNEISQMLGWLDEEATVDERNQHEAQADEIREDVSNRNQALIDLADKINERKSELLTFVQEIREDYTEALPKVSEESYEEHEDRLEDLEYDVQSSLDEAVDELEEKRYDL
jgi:hypothetical protein|uniref:Apolipoprotein n=1 Tax=Myoviridae sp. ctshb19 TaxID=2825194 RepID=A0A8S5UG62_9CAUD|nr:MAG TPA: apolipoprotein [Myoviridae sp. ctshb19]